MKLNDIMIQTRFMKQDPSLEKLCKCKRYYKKHKQLDREIVVDQNGVLLDGYVGYLVLRENGVSECDVRIENTCAALESECDYRYTKTTYIVGKHGNNPNEYIWRIAKDTILSDCIVLGSDVLVESQNGNKVVSVINMFTLNHPPVPDYVRKVLRCLIS